MESRRPVRKPRVPQLRFTSNRGIGWHVSYRDPDTGMPRRHRFGLISPTDEAKARALYHAWAAAHLNGDAAPSFPQKSTAPSPNPKTGVTTTALSGSLLEVASGLIEYERGRARKPGETRRRGSVDHRVFIDRSKHIRDFLSHLNQSHGKGAVARMRLADLSMTDVEGYNRDLVMAGYSASQVAKRMQMVRAIINRAGRPEYSLQRLNWNWDSRDIAHGKPTERRTLPTVDQLERLLAATDLRGRTMIWMGIGLGFGQRDLAAVRVGQIAEGAYDLRRGKTGVERYGETPPLVWSLVQQYSEEANRPKGELLFVTAKGYPLVHGRSDAVTQWWNRLRASIGETQKSLSGFYTLRHLGATEYGSRPGCSIGAMKRWLGHSTSSQTADIYLKPVSPDITSIVAYAQSHLANTHSA